jgi:hypothetical protein
MFAPAGMASVVAYRGIIGDAGIVAAFDCLPRRLDQPKQSFLILPRHTALADKAAQRDQRDRSDARVSPTQPDLLEGQGTAGPSNSRPCIPLRHSATSLRLIENGLIFIRQGIIERFGQA